MTRTPFDHYAKDVAMALLAPFGKAESDARLAAETQYADLRFVMTHDVAAPETSRDFLTDLAPRMLFEFARHPPDIATMVSWTHKRDGWFLALRREARRRKQPPPSLPPVLCALYAGDPEEARIAYDMTAPVGLPGCYQSVPAGTFRLVVISQLPKTRATLLARTMGSRCATRSPNSTRCRATPQSV